VKQSRRENSITSAASIGWRKAEEAGEASNNINAGGARRGMKSQWRRRVASLENKMKKMASRRRRDQTGGGGSKR